VFGASASARFCCFFCFRFFFVFSMLSGSICMHCRAHPRMHSCDHVLCVSSACGDGGRAAQHRSRACFLRRTASLRRLPHRKCSSRPSSMPSDHTPAPSARARGQETCSSSPARPHIRIAPTPLSERSPWTRACECSLPVTSSSPRPCLPTPAIASTPHQSAPSVFSVRMGVRDPG
jgi:hypothetical protein